MSFIADIFAARTAAKGQAKAADAARTAASESTAEARRQYDLSRADNQPWLEAGRNALSVLSNVGKKSFNADAYLAANPDVRNALAGGAFGGEGGLAGAAQRHWLEYGQNEGRTNPGMTTGYEAFTASPDYQFRLDEGARALTARNSALGIQDSGAATKSALKYGQNLASGEFGDWWNRQAGLAGVGQTAAAANQNLGQNFSNATTSINTNKANALGSSYINQGNIYGNLFSNLGGQAQRAATMFLGG